MNETIITLRESESLTNIQQRCNGIVVQERKIKVDAFIRSMLEIMEESDFTEFLMDKSNNLYEFLGDWIVEQDAERINDIFKLFLDRVQKDYTKSKELDMKLIAGLFGQIAQHFDLSKLNDQSLQRLLRLLVMKTESIEDNAVLQEMFLILLEKVDLLSGSSDYIGKVLELSLTKATREQHMPTIKAMFSQLAKKAEKDWIRRVLAPYTKKRKVYKSPILPKNCLIFNEELDGTYTAIIDVPKQNIDVSYHRSIFEQVGHPRLLFEFRVSGEKITSCRVVAVKEQASIKPSSPVFYYPFSNVFSDFSTCWPELKKLSIQDLQQVGTLPYLFLKSPGNDHAFSGKNLREIYATLENQDFDDSMLKPTNKTIQEIFDLK